MSKRKQNRKRPELVWDGMTRKQHSGIADYMKRMAITLGLTHWHLTLSEEFTAEDGHEEALATCTVLPGRHVAEFRLAKDFNSFKRKEKKQAIIHELLHCHQQRLLLWADDTLKEALGVMVYEMFMAGYRDNFEHMVDDLAVVLARLIDDRECKHLLTGGKK